MKKLGSILLSTTIMFSSLSMVSFGEDQTKYTLFDMNKYMLEHNLDYIKSKEKLEKEERDLKDANTQRDAIHIYDFKDDDYDNYDVQIKQNLNPIKAESEYLAAKFELLDLEKSLERKLQNAYQTLVYDQDLFTTLSEEYSLMKKMYETKEKELSLGTISQNDFLEFQKSYKEMHVQLISQGNSIANQKRELSILVGLPVSNSYEIERVGITPWNFEEKSLEDYKAVVLENSYQIDKLDLDKEIAEKELLYKHRFAGFTEAKKEMEDLNDTIKDIPRQQDNAKNTVEYDIVTKYNNVLIEKENLDIAKIELDQAIRENKADLVKFDQGIINEFDKLTSMHNLSKAQKTFNDARLKYILTTEELKDYIDINSIAYRLEK